MSRLVLVVGGLFLALLTVSACREYLPTNRYLQLRPHAQTSQSTADARRAFDHGSHAKVFEARGVTCGDCHRFDAEIEAGPPVAAALSAAAQYPGAAACHYCHGPSETQISDAPSACTTCHRNTAPLLPPNHQIAWLRVHASVASADPTACQGCHRDAFCINCHQNRDEILTFMHERNYLSYHSVDARSNPMQCGSCHREDFCINCHAQSAR